MSTLRESTFTNAKSGLSRLMDDVVHCGRPHLVQRHGGREAMLLVRPDDAIRWLSTFRFTLDVVLDEDEVAVSASPVGVVGLGDSLDGALDDLVAELRAYADRYFERPQFYSQTRAAHHEPWLLRLALTPPDEHRALLNADIDASVPAGVEVAASV